MAGKFVMASTQTKAMELLVHDIGFRENRARTISSITITGQNIRFDGTSSRIISLTNEFTKPQSVPADHDHWF